MRPVASNDPDWPRDNWLAGRDKSPKPARTKPYLRIMELIKKCLLDLTQEFSVIRMIRAVAWSVNVECFRSLKSHWNAMSHWYVCKQEHIRKWYAQGAIELTHLNAGAQKNTVFGPKKKDQLNFNVFAKKFHLLLWK